MFFEKWPSIPRRSKEQMTITEKIDGTNAAILFFPLDAVEGGATPICTVDTNDGLYGVWAQSRTRFIYPDSDNFGFARWVSDNAQALYDVLGIGRHYGEWWGQGIQCGYGLKEKRFSLFKAPRWQEIIGAFEDTTPVKGLRTVPILYSGKFLDGDMDRVVETLSKGSLAAPEFTGMPEGVVVYLREANTSYKILLENDDIHKWEVK
jgi:hypothetical protein